MREIPLVDGEYYHVFNRGVAKQEIFTRPRHYVRFERTCDYYSVIRPQVRFSKYLQLKQISQLKRNPLQDKSVIKQIELVAYCLMPNHFHFLIKQTHENGVSNFMRNLGNSYTRYFNTFSRRVGPVFQGQFKAVHVESNGQLIHLSRYIHINPVVAGIVPKNQIESYAYSSFDQYVNKIPSSTLVVNPIIVLDQFGRNESYRKFCLDYTDYALTIAAFKHAIIDGED